MSLGLTVAAGGRSIVFIKIELSYEQRFSFVPFEFL